MRIGRQLKDLVALAVRRRERRHPLRGVRREVRRGEARPRFGGERSDALRDRAVVERRAASARDEAERLREVRVRKPLACARRARRAARLVAHRERLVEPLRRARVLPVRRDVRRVCCHSPVARNHRRDGKALGRVANRRRKEVRPRHGAVLRMKLAPPHHGARNGDRQRPLCRDRAGRRRARTVRCNERGHLGARRRRGGAARRVDPAQALALRLRRVVYHRHKVAAHAVHHWLHDALHRIRGDCRVDGVPSRLEDVERSDGRERLRRRRHPIASEHWRASRKLQTDRTTPSTVIQMRIDRAERCDAAILRSRRQRRSAARAA